MRTNGGLHAYALRCIKGYILDYLKEWCRQEIKRDTGADRELSARPGSTAEEIVEAIGCKLKAAEEAIAFAGGHDTPPLGASLKFAMAHLTTRPISTLAQHARSARKTISFDIALISVFGVFLVSFLLALNGVV